MSVTISTPADGSQVNIPGGGGLWTVKGTVTLPDQVDGTLTDEKTGNVYLATNNAYFRKSAKTVGVDGEGYGGWTLNFNIQDTIGVNDYLYMYAYDTATGDGDQFTYQQAAAAAAAAAAGAGLNAGDAVTIEVHPKNLSATVEDIEVKVTHPQNTKGFVFLILRKNNDPQPSPTIVESHRLSAAGQTRHTFRRISTDYWDLISVNVVARGWSEKETVTPVVLRAPKMK